MTSRAPSPPQTPRGPLVSPNRAEGFRADSEPPEGGWDEADTVTSIPDEERPPPKVITRSAPPPPVEPGPQSVTTPDALPVVATPIVSLNASAMSPAMREEVWAIVRAAVQEAVSPLLAKQREVEARLERMDREIETRAAAGARTVRHGGNVRSSPVAVSAPPTPEIRVAERAPDVPKLPPHAFPHDDPVSSSAPPTRPSFTSTSYGLVMAHPPGPRPSIDVDVASVGPIEVPDFGKGKRMVGRLVIGLLLLGVLSAIVATVMSHA